MCGRLCLLMTQYTADILRPAKSGGQSMSTTMLYWGFVGMGACVGCGEMETITTVDGLCGVIDGGVVAVVKLRGFLRLFGGLVVVVDLSW